MYARFNFIWERNIDNKKEIQSNKAITTDNTIKKGKILIELDHIWTFMGGKQGGIGNQNYSGKNQYGLFDNLTIGAFYTEADDPLFKRVGKQRINLKSYGLFTGQSLDRMLSRKKHIKFHYIVH